LLRERSISGLLAYFSFLRSLWASMLVISGPLYLAKRMMAYCGWLNGGPPFWQFNRIDDGHSTDSFLLGRWMSFEYKSGAGHFVQHQPSQNKVFILSA